MSTAKYVSKRVLNFYSLLVLGNRSINVCICSVAELFHTERSHVRALKILDQLFYQPMREQQIIPAEQLQLLFANLDVMLEIHSQFNNNMKLKKKENSIVGDIGDILLKMVSSKISEEHW